MGCSHSVRAATSPVPLQLLSSKGLQVKAGDKVSITLSRHDTSIRAGCFVVGSEESAAFFDLRSNATLSDLYLCLDKHLRHHGLYVAGFFNVSHMEWKDSLESVMDDEAPQIVAKIQLDICSTQDCKMHEATTLLEQAALRKAIKTFALYRLHSEKSLGHCIGCTY
jgi:hypothetical protein